MGYTPEPVRGTQSDADIKATALRNREMVAQFQTPYSQRLLQVDPPETADKALILAWNSGHDVTGTPHLDPGELFKRTSVFQSLGVAPLLPSSPLLDDVLVRVMPKHLVDKKANSRLWLYLVLIGEEPAPFSELPFNIDASYLALPEVKAGAAMLVEGILQHDESKTLGGHLMLARQAAISFKLAEGPGSEVFVETEHEKDLWKRYYAFGSIGGVMEEQKRLDALKAGTPGAGPSGGEFAPEAPVGGEGGRK